MTDNDLFTLVRTAMLAQMPARGLVGWDVVRDFAPDQQGANSTPTVYLHKLGDKRHGSPQRKYEYDPVGDAMTASESTQYETSFQASVLLTETTDPAALTASDAINVLADIMQSDETLAALAAQSVGILRVAAAPNPYNVNDKSRFQADPSFDFVLTYRRGFTTVAPAVAVFQDGIERA